MSVRPANRYSRPCRMRQPARRPASSQTPRWRPSSRRCARRSTRCAACAARLSQRRQRSLPARAGAFDSGCYAWAPPSDCIAAMTARIVSLHIYPIKSCAGIDLAESPIDRAGLAGDRRWMIRTAQGQFMTQRQWPAMALIRPAITADALELHAPGVPALRVPLDGSQLGATVREVTVWKDSVPAREESAEAAAWLSRVLGLDCVLVKLDAQARRPAKPEWVDRWRGNHAELAGHFAGDHVFGFADGFPLLVTNQASLDDLNARLAARGEP